MADESLVGEILQCPNCGKKNRVPAAADGTPRCGNCHKPLPWIADAGDATFAEVAERSRVPALLDFWAPWCVPCRMVSPALERIATNQPGPINIVKVMVDTVHRLQHRLGIATSLSLL